MKNKLDFNKFEDRLEYGKEAEDDVYKFLLRKGWDLIPTTPFKSDVGQRVYTLNDDYPAPDTIAFKKGKSRWVEVKHKTNTSFFRNTWTVGMEKRYYKSYLKIEEDSGIPVNIFFLVDISDYNTPFGLFEMSLQGLSETIHSSANGILFWDIYKMNILKLN